MKINYLIAVLFLCGCTVNQQNRIHELQVRQTGAFPRTKDIQVVKEREETGTFSLKLEKGESALSTKNGNYPVFYLKGEGLPLKERFILARIDRVTGTIDPQCEFEALENGELVVYKEGIRQENEIPFIASEGLKVGYPIDYTIVSKKTYESAQVEFIPYPIEATGAGGARIEALVSHRLATHFQVRAEGFIPFEKLTLVHTSGSTKEKLEITADETGAFQIGLNPTILGKMGGEAELLVERNEEREGILLAYPWGTGIEKKTWKERERFPMLFVANREPSEDNHAGLIALLE